MAGRAAYIRSVTKHAQRTTDYVKPSPIDNDSWFTAGLEACRTLAKGENIILVDVFAAEMDVPAPEADRRLRHLSMMGVLQMHVERKEGTFVQYYWRMVDPNLPRASDLHKPQR